MQLLLNLDDRTHELTDIHQRLKRHFGLQGPYRALDPVSQLVMALIGGKTRGEVSLSAFEGLVARFGHWEAVRDAPVAEIYEVICGVTFAELKAPRLKASLLAVTRAHGALTLSPLEDMTVGDALAWLERLPGVGRKVAAATLNFSTLRKAALVIDSHHLRVLRRLGYVGPRTGIAQAYDLVMPLLPESWTARDFDQHHQLMKVLGQEICRNGVPICERCPLRSVCATAQRDGRRRHDAGQRRQA
ncbi:endonuclease [Boseongicola sp. H5]|uniref:endonuclease III domain-containing protein n=1 Tax=Boseongicola sp. H5 TaxID=2763261 RepID=UPI001D0AC927|nr:endonuclease [Boseongicola sp. H5]